MKKLYICWFCLGDIEKDVVKKHGSARKVPIWHSHPRDHDSLIHLIIPEPIHEVCYKILLNTINIAQREKRDELFKKSIQ